MNTIYLKEIKTPLGELFACADNKGVCLLEFPDSKGLDKELKEISKTLQGEIVKGENEHLKLLERELNEYFQGKRKSFSVLLNTVGTDFQKQVWESLLKIPYGTTTSYQKQANLLGRPKAVRAVANANGQNKISILIPCHRVIGSNGTLTGYGGGLLRKQKLLEIEGVLLGFPSGDKI